MTHDEMIAVIQAHKEGKEIECSMKDKNCWGKSTPDWAFHYCDYRVKPVPPEPREWWLHDGRAHLSESHAINSRMVLGSSYPVIHVREVLPESK